MTLQYILELIGTALFAISGALLANDKNNADWFGVTFIGFVTSLGGGTVRDVLLGAYPIAWIHDVNIFIAIIIGIAMSSLFYETLVKYRRNLFIFETLAIAMFTIIGTEKALQYGVNPLIASILGMFSAVMGGVLRDVLTNDTPVLFRKEIYATACIAGALLYVLLLEIHTSRPIALSVSMFLIAAIRIISIRYRLTLPQFRRTNKS
jgi:uncharacterized membrane protein YeiH